LSLFDKIFKKKFEGKSRELDRTSEEYKSNIRAATAALLVLMAHADDSFSEVEYQKISAVLKKKFNLSGEQVDELLEESKSHVYPEEQVQNTLKFIDKNFYFDEKYDLMKNLYAVMLADSDLSTMELKLFTKISAALGINKIALATIRTDVERELNS